MKFNIDNSSLENRFSSKVFILLARRKTIQKFLGFILHLLFGLWGAYDKFPDIFCMGTLIDSTHMKL